MPVRMVKSGFSALYRLTKVRFQLTYGKPPQATSRGLQRVMENYKIKKRAEFPQVDSSITSVPLKCKGIAKQAEQRGSPHEIERQVRSYKLDKLVNRSSLTPTKGKELTERMKKRAGYRKNNNIPVKKIPPKKSQTTHMVGKPAQVAKHTSDSQTREVVGKSTAEARRRNRLEYKGLLTGHQAPLLWFYTPKPKIQIQNKKVIGHAVETLQRTDQLHEKVAGNSREEARLFHAAAREKRNRSYQGLLEIGKDVVKLKSEIQSREAHRKHIATARIRKNLALHRFKNNSTIRKSPIYRRRKKREPLRILFCGSDEFSCASLQALAELQKRAPKLIDSIDVMIRPGKPSGRSMKEVRQVPIKAVAQGLGLCIHERDTFTGWELPQVNGKRINLIIAVSFGLFVPPRILKKTFYGGLNVHPSLLPNLRGPAPIHHTILTKQAYTGVTLQTLHPEKVDHGIILSRTKNPVPVSDDTNYTSLHQRLATLGADLLVDSLERNVHVPPCHDIGNYKVYRGELQHAPKITAADRRMDFTQDDRFMRQYRALGRLWADICIDENTTRRVVFEDFEKFDYYAANSKLGTQSSNDYIRPLLFKDTNIEFYDTSEPPPDGFRVLVSPTPDGGKKPIFYTEYGDAILIALPGKTNKQGIANPVILRVTKVTIAGENTKPAAAALRSLQKGGKWIIEKPDDRPFDLKEYRFSRLALWGSRVEGFLRVSRFQAKRNYLQDLLAPKEENKGADAPPSKPQKKTIS